MDALKVGLCIFGMELIGISVLWPLYCLLTGKKQLLIEKFKGCLDIAKYVGQYWFDVFCIISYGIMLAAEAIIRFFYIVGIIIGDAIRKIIHAAKTTVEIINLIIRWSKRRQAAKKLVFEQKKSEALDPKESDPIVGNAIIV